MIEDEGRKISNVFKNMTGTYLDGKKCIKEMIEHSSKNWKQMEWMGWYNEENARSILIAKIGGSEGPRYGNTRIDYMNEYAWDIKTHSLFDKNGKPEREAILNDTEAIENAIEEFGSIGFVMFLVEPEWDIDGSFKDWHDQMKGETSDYVKERIERGAPSRMRKSACTIREIMVFRLDKESLERGMKEKWLKGFQKGMRNADGSPRRSKVNIMIDRIPIECIITGSVTFGGEPH